ALLRVQGALPLERFTPLFERICEVVHTAHEQGIVHRDLKPENVMVVTRAGRLLPKLVDFGIAAAAADGAGELAGSPPYMARELWVGGGAASARSDVYALGILAYEALTARLPFRGEVADVARAHARAALPPLGAGLPAALDAVLARATAKEPDARHAG